MYVSAAPFLWLSLSVQRHGSLSRRRVARLQLSSRRSRLRRTPLQNAIHAARSLTPTPASRAPAGELLAKVRFVCRILQTLSRPRSHCEGGCRENLSVAPLASVSASVPLARASAEPTRRAEPLATDATLRGETFEGVKWRAFFLFSGCETLGFCLLLMACPHGRLSWSSLPTLQCCRASSSRLSMLQRRV